MDKHQEQPTSASQNTPGIFARWVLPTLGNVASIWVLYMLIKESHRFLIDGDTGFHIRIGDLIRQTGAVPRTDPFSFSMQGHEWFAWEWLADVTMSWIHSVFGLAGIVGVSILLLWIVYTLLYHWMLARGAHPLLALALTVFSVQILTTHLLARPHLISLGFLLLCGAILEDYRRHRTRWIYLLPLFIAVWANLHGAFIIVFPMMALYAAGEIPLFSVSGKRRYQTNPSVLKTYLIVGVLSAAASLLTPYGWKLHQHIWLYLNDSALLSEIMEFKSPNFHSATGILVEIVLFLSMGAIAQAARKRRWVDIGLLILWTHLMLKSLRHISPATIIMIPIIAEHWSTLIREAVDILTRSQNTGSRLLLDLRNFLHGFVKIDRRLRGVFAYAAAAIFLCFTIVGPWSDPLLNPHFKPERHPEGGVSFVASMERQGNLYADDEIGDYLIYRLYPQIKVFIDGRSDFYNTGPVWNDYRKLRYFDSSWAEVMKKYDIQRMLLYDKDPLGMIARMSGDWETVYKDEYSRVLVRKTNIEQ